MKKPLHTESETFFSYVDGRISPWDVSDEDVLVEAANRGLKHSFDETSAHIDELMIFESTVAEWLTRLLNEGVTGLMIEELNQKTSDIRYRRLLHKDEGASPRWFNVADLHDEIDSESKAAYAIIHLVGSGAFRRLKQCEEDACDSFFLGPPNSKWCSDGCGSRARGRVKRKRDRESGVLPGT